MRTLDDARRPLFFTPRDPVFGPLLQRSLAERGAVEDRAESVFDSVRTELSAQTRDRHKPQRAMQRA